ncbi:MAG: aspartate carbamoyltransferase catalytic subunit [Bdellovibrionales bacterium]|nr:aspartate carbamoyltransferase catalytic subunit [Bdellovibrionales bacterium]
MSLAGRSFFRIRDFSREELDSVFSRAQHFKNVYTQGRQINHLFAQPVSKPTIVGMVFLEPSTRTRMSFETAVKRMGLQSIFLGDVASTSLSKGESEVDTIETVASLLPDCLVVRFGGSAQVQRCLEKLPLPVINAGSGQDGHPTQALLDFMTMQERFPQMEGQRVLFVGDVLYSRVANSNLELLKSKGVKVGVCSPEFLLPKGEAWQDVELFTDLKEAMAWCSVCMVLRVQQERHGQTMNIDMDEYTEKYRVDAQRMNWLPEESILLNPGPYVDGIELMSDVLSDSRCLIRTQVTNGMFIRAALVSLLCGIEVKGEQFV